MGWFGSATKESRPGTASWEPSRLGLGGEADTHTNDAIAKSEQAVVHDDLTIALVDLTPYHYSARPIQPSDYRLTLRISR